MSALLCAIGCLALLAAVPPDVLGGVNALGRLTPELLIVTGHDAPEGGRRVSVIARHLEMLRLLAVGSGLVLVAFVLTNETSGGTVDACDPSAPQARTLPDGRSRAARPVDAR